MTAQEYLNQGYRLAELIKSNEKEITELNELVKSISSPNLSGMPFSATKNTEPQYAKCIQKITDLENEIKEETLNFLDIKKNIRQAINSVEDHDEYLLLKLKYIHFLTWEQIAEKMSFSLTQVHRIHSKALENIKIPKS